MKRLKRLAWAAAYLAAAAVLVLFVRTIDVRILRTLDLLFWIRAIGELVAVQLLIVALHTLQWGLLLHQEGVRVRAVRLYGARLAGAAVSILSPSLSIGGELVRAALVRDAAPSAGRIAASVTIDKYVELAARMPFVLIGLGILLWRLPHLNPLFLEAGLGFALLVLSAPALLAVLQRGAARSGRRPAFPRFFERALEHIRPGLGRRALRALAGFTRSLRVRRPVTLVPVFLVGLSASAVELLQVHFALGLVGVDGIGGAVAVQSASILGGIVGFLPANVGGMEAANLLSIALLGGGAAAALTYSLLIRGGQAGIVLCGLGYLAVRRLRRPEASHAPRQCCSSK